MSATTIEEAIRQILVNDSAVKAITTRVYPVELPQNPAYPLILYARITGARDHHLQGPSGMASPRFQIEAWDTTYSGAKALAKAIREALDGFRGTVGSVRIGSVLIKSDRDDYESAASCYRIIADCFIIHDE